MPTIAAQVNSIKQVSSSNAVQSRYHADSAPTIMPVNVTDKMATWRRMLEQIMESKSAGRFRSFRNCKWIDRCEKKTPVETNRKSK